MTRGWILFTLFFSLTAAGEGIWVVGENYVAYSDLKKPPTFFNGVEPTSWGADLQCCQLWTTDRNGQLLGYTPTATAPSHQGKADRILSDAEKGVFYTRTGTQLEKRGKTGGILDGWDRPWTSSLLQLLVQESVAFHYLIDQNKLWLGLLSKQFEQTATLDIPTGKTVWGNPKIIADTTAQKAWIGFSTTTATHIYAPVVELRKNSGESIRTFEWKERGLFFDFCLEESGSVLVARDVPSTSGFTVPVYSYLERVAENDGPRTVYSAEVNLLIDAMTCNGSEVFMSQRSIWSSEGSHLLSWDSVQATAKPIFKLPAKAQALYTCSDMAR